MAAGLKLVKVSGTYVAVVECESARGGRGIEYSPFDPSKTWGAKVKFIDDYEVEIKVGEYRLKARRSDRASRLFHGSETGGYGSKPFDVCLLPSSAAPADGKVRFAKIAEHTAVVDEFDMASGSGRGIEYDPLDESRQPWEVWAERRSADELVIRTGPYCLYAWKTGALSNDKRIYGVNYGIGRFTGVETGPYGEHRFEVYQLSTGPERLKHLSSTEWLLLRRGREAGIIRFPESTHPKLENNLEVVVRKLPHADRGIMRVNPEIYPTRDNNIDGVSLAVDTGERTGKYMWYSHHFAKDETKGLFYSRQDEMVLLPYTAPY